VIDNAGSAATLRLRRSANLFGWAAAGGMVFGVLSILSRQVPLIGIVAFVLVPYLAGGVIGDHVYRWPGWVAALAVGAVILWWFVGSTAPSEEWPDYVGVALVSLLISVTTARHRWRLPPRAVRGTPSR